MTPAPTGRHGRWRRVDRLSRGRSRFGGHRVESREELTCALCFYDAVVYHEPGLLLTIEPVPMPQERRFTFKVIVNRHVVGDFPEHCVRVVYPVGVDPQETVFGGFEARCNPAPAAHRAVAKAEEVILRKGVS